MIEVLRLVGPRKFLLHVAWRATEIIFGWVFLSGLGQALWSRDPRSGSRSQTQLQTAVVAHVFYPELLDEILACHRCLPGNAALHITAPSASAAVIEARLAETPSATLHVVPNRGRDIGPFIALLTTGILDPYQAVLKIHTKRSPHLLNGDMRRRIMFSSLAGNKRAVAAVLSHFEKSRTGIVGLGFSFRRGETWWMGTKARGETLCRAMQPTAVPDAAFFEGSMFWFRPAALKPLTSLQLTQDDFEEEQGQVDGTLHHTIERLFTLAARAAGYETLSLRGKRLL